MLTECNPTLFELGVEPSWGLLWRSATDLHCRSGGGGSGPMAVAKWTVCLEAGRPDGTTERIEIAAFQRDWSSQDPGDLGLRLAEAKDLLQALQTHLV